MVEKFAKQNWCTQEIPITGTDPIPNRKFPRVNMPKTVPKCFAIPIAVPSLFQPPEKGKMIRYGMDIVPLSVYLVLSWALQDGDTEQVDQIKSRILN